MRGWSMEWNEGWCLGAAWRAVVVAMVVFYGGPSRLAAQVVANGPEEVARMRLEARAESFVEELARDRLTFVRKEMTAPLSQTLSRGALAGIFSELYRTGGGELLAVGPAEAAPLQPGVPTEVRVPMQFATASYDAWVTFTGQGQPPLVTAFRVAPSLAPPRREFPLPPYAEPTVLREDRLTVEASSGGTTVSLPAILSLPGTASQAYPVPVVLLVAGEGPWDADMTAGGTKPFRDLSMGLASRGVGAMRMAKRSWQQPPLFEDGRAYTLEDAHIADAQAAVRMLRGRPEVSRIVIAGHGLGALLAARLGREAGVKGVVLLAPDSSPSPRRRLAQWEELIARATEPQQRREMQADIDVLRRVVGGQARPEEMVLGLPASYWAGLATLHTPAADVLTLDKPFVVWLTGEAQSDDDAEERRHWRDAVWASRHQGALRESPELDRALRPRHDPRWVDEGVVEALALWALEGVLPQGS